MHALRDQAIRNAEVYYRLRLEDREDEGRALAAWQNQKNSLSSDHARRCVRGLLKNTLLKEALDPLLDIPGMRSGLLISTIHKLLTAKADEEAKAYLDHTHALWVRIAGSKEATAKLEPDDVQALHLRCPRFCTSDAALIHKQMEQGIIFRAFTPNERSAALAEILSIETIITSLHTFSQDIHILQVCATSMRHIVTPRGQTIRQALLGCYRPVERAQESNDTASAAGIAIQELWVFMLGNLQGMANPTSASNKRLAGPITEASHDILVQAAEYAQQLGFRSTEIQRLVHATERGSGDIADPKRCHRTDTVPALHRDALASLVVKHTTERLSRRCGRPKKDSYQLDRGLLTRGNLQADLASLDVRGPELTSFFVLRCQYNAFFGLEYKASRQGSPLPNAAEECLSEPTRTCSPPVERLTLEQSIQNFRKQSVESVRAGLSPITESSSVTSSRESIAPGRAQASPSPEPIRVLFRAYSDGRFHTIKQVDAGDPTAVLKAGRELTNQKMMLLSVDLGFISPEQCFETALVSDLHTIFTLPSNDLKITPELEKAVQQLRTDATRRRR